MTAGASLSGAQFPHLHEHGEHIVHEDWTGAETGHAPNEHFTFIDCPTCGKSPQAQGSPDLYTVGGQSKLRFFGKGDSQESSLRNAHMAHMEGITQSKLSERFGG